MAMTCNANGEYLSRSTARDSLTAFTKMAWVNFTAANVGGYNHLFAVGSSGSGDYLAAGAGSFDGSFGTFLGDWDTDNSGGNLSIATWYHLTWTKSGSSHVIYINGISNATMTSTGAPTTTTLRIGDRSSGNGDYLNGSFEAVKEWSGKALSAMEIKLEMNWYHPVTNLHLQPTWIPCRSAKDVIDLSPSSRYLWTVNGTITTDQGPSLVKWQGKRKQWWLLNTVAAPGGDAVPQAWSQYRLRNAG